MVSFAQLQAIFGSSTDSSAEYRCLIPLNLYNSPLCNSLATQAGSNRHLRILSLHTDIQTTSLVTHHTSVNISVPQNPSLSQELAIQVCLCEDDYPGWLRITDLQHLEFTSIPYQAIAVSETEISSRLPAVIDFTQKAMQQPNYYLWGGTIAPNYDCSGLIQAAFSAAGIWLPRDAYQQHAFTQTIDFKDLQIGDLIFFKKSPEKVSHVALYLGNGYYIHSSGKETGRNGIGIDCLSEHGDKISLAYYQQVFSAGRVVNSYMPVNR